jgi:hypothetical protein
MAGLTYDWLYEADEGSPVSTPISTEQRTFTSESKSDHSFSSATHYIENQITIVSTRNDRLPPRCVDS